MAQEIRNCSAKAIKCHMSQTVEEFIANQKERKRYKLDNIEKADFVVLRKYNLPQNKETRVIDAYHKGHLHGKLELEILRKSIGFVEKYHENNYELLSLGYEYHKIDKDKMVTGAVGKSEFEFRDIVLERCFISLSRGGLN